MYCFCIYFDGVNSGWVLNSGELQMVVVRRHYVDTTLSHTIFKFIICFHLKFKEKPVYSRRITLHDGTYSLYTPCLLVLHYIKLVYNLHDDMKYLSQYGLEDTIVLKKSS